MNLPFRSLDLAAHRELLARLVAAGYDHVWSDEFNGVDGVAALTAMAAWQPSIHCTSAISNVFTRGPALLAMSAAALAGIAPGRATFGIGASSAVIVEQWNGLAYERPYSRLAEMLAFLREVLATGECVRPLPLLGAGAFRLAKVPDHPPRLAVGGLGPRAQRLAAAEADQLITGMIGIGDVGRIREELAPVARTAPGTMELHAGLFLVPTLDGQDTDLLARRHLTTYLPVPAYASFQRWLGRGGALDPMLDAWSAGDRKGAVAALPADVVDELVVTGSPADCATRIRAFLDAGLDGVNLMFPAGVPMDAEEKTAFLCEMRGELASA